MAAPTVYKSSDSGAPVITKDPGTLADALYAILVTGYGSIAGAGWTRPYSGTDKAVFRQGAGLQRCVRVDDTTSGYATARLYAQMSSVDAGDGAAPPVATTVYWGKSGFVGTDAVAWVCLATAQTFYMLIQRNNSGSFDSGSTGDAHIAVGDLLGAMPVSTRTATFLIGSGISSTVMSTPLILSNNGGSNNGRFLIGDASGLVVGGLHEFGARACGAAAQYASAQSGMSNWGAYPNAASGKLSISRLAALERNTYHRRGYMPGLWFCQADAGSLTTLDTFGGSGSLAGRTFLIVRTNGTRAVIFETSGGW